MQPVQAGGAATGSANGYASGGGTTADPGTAAGGSAAAGAGVSMAQGGQGPPASGQVTAPSTGNSPGSGAPSPPPTPFNPLKPFLLYKKARAAWGCPWATAGGLVRHHPTLTRHTTHGVTLLSPTLRPYPELYSAWQGSPGTAHVTFTARRSYAATFPAAARSGDGQRKLARGQDPHLSSVNDPLVTRDLTGLVRVAHIPANCPEHTGGPR